MSALRAPSDEWYVENAKKAGMPVDEFRKAIDALRHAPVTCERCDGDGMVDTPSETFRITCPRCDGLRMVFPCA